MRQRVITRLVLAQQIPRSDKQDENKTNRALAQVLAWPRAGLRVSRAAVAAVAYPTATESTGYKIGNYKFARICGKHIRTRRSRRVQLPPNAQLGLVGAASASASSPFPLLPSRLPHVCVCVY